MLSSGTVLDVIEIDLAGSFKVRTGNGIEGWVLTRYLGSTPSFRDRVQLTVNRK